MADYLSAVSIPASSGTANWFSSRVVVSLGIAVNAGIVGEACGLNFSCGNDSSTNRLARLRRRCRRFSRTGRERSPLACLCDRAEGPKFFPNNVVSFLGCIYTLSPGDYNIRRDRDSSKRPTSPRRDILSSISHVLSLSCGLRAVGALLRVLDVKTRATRREKAPRCVPMKFHPAGEKPRRPPTLPAIWYDAAPGTAFATTANYPSPCVRRPNVSWSFRVLPAM